MHESALARQVLEIVLDRAGGRPVRRVAGRVVDAEAMRPESLAFHFAAHARDTAASGAVLDLKVEAAPVRCPACRHVFQVEHHIALCPHCQSAAGEFLVRPGVYLETIEVD